MPMRNLQRVVYPFTAIAGQEKMEKGLILNAINPRLGGILIRGEKGTAKSTAVRALAALLPDIEVVKGCPFNCDPKKLISFVSGAGHGWKTRRSWKQYHSRCRLLICQSRRSKIGW